MCRDYSQASIPGCDKSNSEIKELVETAENQRIA